MPRGKAGKSPVEGGKSPATKEKAPKKVKAPKAEGEKTKGRGKKRQSNSYASYIYKVLRQVHPDTGKHTIISSIIKNCYRLIQFLIQFRYL